MGEHKGVQTKPLTSQGQRVPSPPQQALHRLLPHAVLPGPACMKEPQAHLCGPRPDQHFLLLGAFMYNFSLPASWSTPAFTSQLAPEPSGAYIFLGQLVSGSLAGPEGSF